MQLRFDDFALGVGFGGGELAEQALDARFARPAAVRRGRSSARSRRRSTRAGEHLGDSEKPASASLSFALGISRSKVAPLRPPSLIEELQDDPVGRYGRLQRPGWRRRGLPRARRRGRSRRSVRRRGAGRLAAKGPVLERRVPRSSRSAEPPLRTARCRRGWRTRPTPPRCVPRCGAELKEALPSPAPARPDLVFDELRLTAGGAAGPGLAGRDERGGDGERGERGGRRRGGAGDGAAAPAAGRRGGSAVGRRATPHGGSPRRPARPARRRTPAVARVAGRAARRQIGVVPKGLHRMPPSAW